ncbi:phage terminase large subunit family protein, partial [Candidatus Latescibacterota bacterium]
MSSDVDVLEEVRLGLAPEPLLTVSEWADRHRLLPPTSAEPGRWRTSRVPYLRDIMDALSPSHPAEFVTVVKGSQIGASEGGNCWIGYCIHHAPGLMLIVYPGLSEVKRNTSTRIDPLI